MRHLWKHRAVAGLWIVFFCAMVVGARTRFFLPPLLLFTVVFIGVQLHRGTLLWNDRAVKRFIYGMLACFGLTRILGKFFRFEAGVSQYWDFGQYLQVTYNLATTGRAVLTFEGKEVDYFGIHWSLSAYFSALLYRWVSHPIALWIWQTFWLFVPALILSLLARHTLRDLPSPTRRVLIALAPLLWMISPVFSGQFYWSYNFHIAGVALLLLSVLAVEKERWGLWSLSLILACIEKEEFGLFAFSFGGLLALEEWSKGNVKRILLALATSAAGLACFMGFFAFDSQLDRVALYFPEWGTSFWDVVFGPLRDPLTALDFWTRPAVLKLLSFLFLISGIWLAPNRKALRYVLTPLPVILAYGLASYEPLTNLRNHYALPVLVFGCVALICGTIPAYSHRAPAPYWRFAIAVVVMSLFGFHNPVRSAREAHAQFRSRAKQLDQLNWVKNDKDLVVCCESSLCAHFAERPVVIDYDRCRADEQVLKPYRGRKMVWVTQFRATEPEPIN